MTIFFVVFLLVCFWRCRRPLPTERPLSKDHTTVVNGIFIMWVFLRHVSEYIGHADNVLCCWIDRPYQFVNALSGHLVVAMFMFNSGYGVMSRIKSAGRDYVLSMPKRRLWPTLRNFDVAVAVYAGVVLLLGKSVSCSQFIMSLVAWDDVGNSNWYIFAILCCYTLTYFSFSVSTHTLVPCLLVCAGVFVYVLVMPLFKPFFWYDTVLCYAVGVILAREEDALCKVGHKGIFIVSLFVCFVLFRVLAIWSPVLLRSVLLNLHAVCFVLLCAFGLCRIHLGNPILLWAGCNLFPLYIYQRLPMMLTSHFGLNVYYRYVFVLLSGILVVGIVLVYNRFGKRER